MARPLVKESERCRAMTRRTGIRCPFRKAEGDLCWRHARYGAIIPDDWTQPDNLPVFLVAV